MSTKDAYAIHSRFCTCHACLMRESSNRLFEIESIVGELYRREDTFYDTFQVMCAMQRLALVVNRPYFSGR